MPMAPTKARQLIEGASFGPEALKAIGKAWAEIVGNFGDEPEDVEKARRRLVKALLSIANEGRPELDPERLVFIDETGASTKRTRLYGRAKRGKRCRAAVPHGHWKTTTFTGALRRSGMTAPMNGAAFFAYVEQVLAPTLRPGDVVVMDNLPAHKSAAVRATIEQKAPPCAICRRTLTTSTRSRMPLPN